jgi:amidase
MGTELWRHGAGELAGMIASKEVSSREVVEAHLDRIAKVNPHLNAIVRHLGDQARDGADAADRAQASGSTLGPLHGVPFTIKENIDLAGTPTTNSLPAFADAIAATDAPIVERMKAAGAIPIGRTNLPDLGLRVSTSSSLHGLTRNPWHPDRTAGGSSGGEGSALASGMSPIGLGNDIGGSLRNPAHCCGIASIKPTQLRVPHATVVPPLDGMLTAQFMLSNGPMARSVADVRLGLRTIAGAHRRDPYSASVPLDGMGPTTGKLRIGVVTDPAGSPTHAHVRSSVRTAADALSNAGHHVSDAELPRFTDIAQLWGAWLAADVRTMLPLLEMVMGPDAISFLRANEEATPHASVDEYIGMQTTRQTIAREWAAFFADYDGIVLPVWTHPAFTHDADIASAEAVAHTLDQLRPVMPANLLGLPAVVVPAAIHDGLPMGVQVMADRWQDLTALAVAEDIERAVGRFTPIDPVLA